MPPLQPTTTPPAASGAPGDREEADVGGSRARRVAFRIVAAATSLWVLALMVFALTEVVFMWLPRDTLLSVGQALDLGDIDLAHRAHFMSVGVVAWALVLGLVVQLRRPARRAAPLLHALAITLGGAVLFALSGTFGEWLLTELTTLAPLLLLALLHPRARQLVRMPSWDRGMTGLAAVAAVPWLFFAVTQAQQQWRNVPGDAHAEMEHWAAVALLALLVVACAFIGSTDHSGWRLTAWIAAVASINYGLHSLVYPEPASAAPALWALAAIAWGTAYAATIIRRNRSPQQPGPTPRGRGRLLWMVPAAVIATLAFPAGVWAADAFTDVAEGNVHHDAITAVRDAGVTAGCAEGRYCPNDPVRRDQMAAFMDRLGALSPGQEPVVNAAAAKHADDSDALGGLQAEELLDRLEAVETQLAGATARIDTLEAENAELQATLAGVSRSTIDGRDTLRLESMNLQLVNGTDSTDGEPNGLGNLIIGYNAPRSGTEPTDRAGSHYLVTGDFNHWTRFAGLLAGVRNTASGDWASVTGGASNTASGTMASVTGYNNTASGTWASVTGGRKNTANGDWASVSGGEGNTASGDQASVTGGQGNTAAALWSTVAGGREGTIPPNSVNNPGTPYDSLVGKTYFPDN